MSLPDLLGIPTLNFNSYFYSTVCHVCKLRNQKIKLKTCSGCQLICYCSKAHQKVHWPKHKQLCKAIRAVCEKSRKKYMLDVNGDIKKCQYRDLKTAKSTSMMVLCVYLQRQLTKCEHQMLTFPRLCEVCNEHESTKLFDCDRCFSASYCSKKHQRFDLLRHQQFCKQLDLAFSLDSLEFNNEEDLIIPSAKTSNTDTSTLPESMLEFVNNYIQLPSTCDNLLLKYSTASVYSPICTLLHCLQVSGLLKSRKLIRNKLIVHVIGATTEKCINFQDVCVDFLCNWIINVSNISFVFVGPNVLNDVCDHNLTYEVNTPHKTCSITLETHSMLYHDCVQLIGFKKPDFIIAFNCGFHEFQGSDLDTWSKTLQVLTSLTKTPFCFTSFNKMEAAKDLACVLNVKHYLLDVVVECDRNLYFDPRPLREWERTDEDVFYRNNCLSVVISKFQFRWVRYNNNNNKLYSSFNKNDTSLSPWTRKEQLINDNKISLLYDYYLQL